MKNIEFEELENVLRNICAGRLYCDLSDAEKESYCFYRYGVSREDYERQKSEEYGAFAGLEKLERNEPQPMHELILETAVHIEHILSERAAV